MSSSEVKERIGQLCTEFKLPTVGAEAVPWFTRSGHPDSLPTLLKCWNRRLRTAGKGASSGSDVPPSYPQARPGILSSIIGFRLDSDSRSTTSLRESSSNEA